MGEFREDGGERSDVGQEEMTLVSLPAPRNGVGCFVGQKAGCQGRKAMGRRYDHDDDDDRRSRRPAAGESGGMTAVKILAIIGTVILGVTIVCGGLGAFGIYLMVTAADR